MITSYKCHDAQGQMGKNQFFKSLKNNTLVDLFKICCIEHDSINIYPDLNLNLAYRHIFDLRQSRPMQKIHFNISMSISQEGMGIV